MTIDNPLLLAFVNDTVRNLGDRLAGLLPVPVAVLNAVAGQGHSATLGTTDDKLFQTATWTADDYTALGAPQPIAGSDASGRTLLTNYDVIGIVRVMVALKAMADANPALGPLVAKVAVNPRV